MESVAFSRRLVKTSEYGCKNSRGCRHLTPLLIEACYSKGGGEHRLIIGSVSCRHASATTSLDKVFLQGLTLEANVGMRGYCGMGRANVDKRS